MSFFLDLEGLERLWSQILLKLGGKVDKVDGKELSTNDFTNEYKNKLDNIDETASVEEITDDEIDAICAVTLELLDEEAF